MAKPPFDKKAMLKSEDFENTYETQVNSIYRFLLFRTNNVQLSEDLTSTTFEKAWLKRDTFKGGSMPAWLHKIARNVLIDHWRKTKEIARDDIDNLIVDSRPSMATQIDSELLSLELKKAFTKLPDGMRSVIYLRFIIGLPSKEVAKRLNLTDSNVRVLQYRALKKLRGYLDG